LLSVEGNKKAWPKFIAGLSGVSGTSDELYYNGCAAPRQPHRFSSFSLYHFIGFASLLFRVFFSFII
jgi:hypothetical protein